MASEQAMDELIKALTQLYRTWVRMACLLEEDLIVAPPGGHILTSEIVPILTTHKTESVMQLVRRMPYYRCTRDRPGLVPVTCPELSPAARVQDYWNHDPPPGPVDLWEQQLYQPNYVAELADPPIVTRSELPWTLYPQVGGYSVIIDTATENLTARVYSHNWRHCAYNHGPGGVSIPCHMLCQGKAARTLPAAELFQEYTQRFLNAEWMPDDTEGWMVVTLGSDVDWIDRYHKAYKDCGWPDKFDSEKLQAYRQSDGYYADLFGEDSEGTND